MGWGSYLSVWLNVHFTKSQQYSILLSPNHPKSPPHHDDSNVRIILVCPGVIVTLLTISVTTAAADVIDIPKWIVPYEGDQNIDAKVGDTLTFEWDATLYGPHNVYIHPTMDCDLEGAVYVGETSPTSYVLTDQDGTPEGNQLFFSCDVGDGAHCDYGQWLIVTVFSDPDTTAESSATAAGVVAYSSSWCSATLGITLAAMVVVAWWAVTMLIGLDWIWDTIVP